MSSAGAGARSTSDGSGAEASAPTARGSLDGPTVWLQEAILVACAVLCALIETMLVPYRIGTVIVPVAIGAAVLSNVALPLLAWRARPQPLLAAIPFGAWVLTVLYLSQSRPEGDVLLPGGESGVTYVSYGLLLAGFLTGLGTVVALANRRPRLRSTSGAPRR